jgi:hypothetical protein
MPRPRKKLNYSEKLQALNSIFSQRYLAQKIFKSKSHVIVQNAIRNKRKLSTQEKRIITMLYNKHILKKPRKKFIRKPKVCMEFINNTTNEYVKISSFKIEYKINDKRKNHKEEIIRITKCIRNIPVHKKYKSICITLFTTKYTFDYYKLDKVLDGILIEVAEMFLGYNSSDWWFNYAIETEISPLKYENIRKEDLARVFNIVLARYEENESLDRIYEDMNKQLDYVKRRCVK